MKRYNADAYSGMKANGFTLIELVIVIVILGILSAAAVPKFMSMQGDARASTLIAIKGAVKSANSMIYAKSLTNNINNNYSEKSKQYSKIWAEDCSTGSCVKIGNIWVYTKFGYVDRNSVAYLLDTDISGNQDTKVVTNKKTEEKITVPARNTTQGGSNYNCPTGNNSVLCKDHDFCQCRVNQYAAAENRDTQFIVPKGFDYNINKHPKGGCYFGYTTSDVVNNSVKPPVYTLKTGGC